MLSPLRSTLIRSPSLCTRLSSSQIIANSAILSSVFTSFRDESPDPLVGGVQQPKRRATPLDKIEVPLPRDPLLDFFTSLLMNNGKRARAERCASEILLHINALTRAPPMPILREAVLLAAPALKLVEHKVSAKSVVKPLALSERQRTKRAIQWILDASEQRPGYTRGERIARECIGILQGSSPVFKNKDDLHKKAMVNRANIPRTK